MEVLKFLEPALKVGEYAIEYWRIWTPVVLAGIALYIVWQLLKVLVRIVIAAVLAFAIACFSVPGFYGRALSFLSF